MHERLQFVTQAHAPMTQHDEREASSLTRDKELRVKCTNPLAGREDLHAALRRGVKRHVSKSRAVPKRIRHSMPQHGGNVKTWPGTP